MCLSLTSCWIEIFISTSYFEIRSLWQLKIRAILARMEFDDSLLVRDKMLATLSDGEKERKDRVGSTRVYQSPTLQINRKSEKTSRMETLPLAYTHQLLGFTSSHFRPPTTNVQRTAITSVVSPAAAGIGSNFAGSCKLRQRLNLRRLSLFPSSSRLRTSHPCKSQIVQDFVPVASAGYAVLLLGGGLFAYNKSGSKGSLFGGLTGATLMSVAYYLMQTSETKEIGDALAFGASLLFAFIFGIRLAATRKLIPAGLLLGVSIGLTALTFSAYLQDRI